MSTTDTRRQALQKLVDEHGQALVAKRMGKPDRQIGDMLAGRKSFGEKVARAMENAWTAATGQYVALVSPDLGDASMPVEKRPSWPFRASYDDYLSLPQPKKDQLDTMVSGFISGAAPMKSPTKTRAA